MLSTLSESQKALRAKLNNVVFPMWVARAPREAGASLSHAQTGGACPPPSFMALSCQCSCPCRVRLERWYTRVIKRKEIPKACILRYVRARQDYSARTLIPPTDQRSVSLENSFTARPRRAPFVPHPSWSMMCG